jgi:sterol desaturase/sphingolipid hydroxylase (fatty acid hydroxylase superfamily)
MPSQPARSASLPLYLIWPAVFTGSLWAAHLLLEAGLEPGLAVLLVTVGNMLTVAGFEQLVPRKAGAGFLRDGQALHDVGHGLSMSLLGAPLGRALGSAIVIGAVALAGGDAARGLWPGHWHLAAQVALAVGIGSFFDYWKHRAYHSIDRLWWFHAIHHSADRMNILKAGRLHFMEGVFRYLVVTTPLLAVGAPGETILWYGILDNVLGNLNHCDVDLRFPRFFHYVTATLQVHYLHHSRERDLQDSNFASYPLWDILFGTWRSPLVHADGTIGIEEDPVPRGFGAQVLFPFRKLAAYERRRKRSGRSFRPRMMKLPR